MKKKEPRHFFNRILAIDIGNTKTVFAVFINKRIIRRIKVLNKDCGKKWTVSSVLKRFFDIDSVVLCSVVPRFTVEFSKHIKYILRKPLTIINSNTVSSIMPIRYKQPYKVGADRLVNAIAGRELYGKPVIIIDFGTALTFDCVDSTGSYLGGLIFPGLELAGLSLYEHTAKLPKVKINKFPTLILGTTTKQCIQSGLCYGYIGIINYITKLLKHKLGKNTKTVITGGAAKYINKKLKLIYNRDLTIKGLKIVNDILLKEN